ncbi:MAG: hypothetical protein M1836_008199 [Candelina mexicana]|nr:MAG: hypothetical protein M1836_008199 [Candelina mexicana]
MINSLGRSFRNLRAKLSARQISLPNLSLYSKDASSASSEHLFGVGVDTPLEGDFDAASYGLRPPCMPVSPGRAFRVPSDETNVEDDQGPILGGDGIPLIDLRPNGARAHVESSVNETGQNVTLHLDIDLVKTLQDVLKGRHEAAALQQRLRGAESRIDTSENILEMKRQELLALSEMLKNTKVDVETLIEVRQDVKVLDREIHEMTEYQEKSVAEREDLTQTLSNNAVYQEFLEDRLFDVLDDAMVACNLFEPADETTEFCDKTSTHALSPPESLSSFVRLEELAHRTEFQEQQLVRKNVLDTYRAAEDRFLTLQQVFDHRDDQERGQKQAFRNAQADGEVGSMTTEDFDVRFLMGSMQLTTDLKIAQQACFEARGEAMAHGCLHNEPDQESDFVDCSSDGYAASIMDELIAEAPRERIQCWTDGCEQHGMIQDGPRPIDDVYNTDEDGGFVRTEDSASQVARGKRREMIDLYNEYRATQWSPIN